MQHVKTKASETTVFFDPYAPNPRRATGGPYCPYFPYIPFKSRQRPRAPHVVEPARKVMPEWE